MDNKLEKEYARKASEITLNKIDSYDELNAETKEEGDEKFIEKTRELWDKFAVSGVMRFDKELGKMVMRSSPDLDGEAALGILKKSRIWYFRFGIC